MAQTNITLIEERELLEKLSLYLYLGRKSLMSYVFILSILPVKIIGLITSLQKIEKWYWSIPIFVFWVIWTWVHGAGIRRRNKICREILNIKTSSEKWSPRLKGILSISKWELALLLSLALSPFAFIPALIFFKEYRELAKNYEMEMGEKGRDIENILNKTIKITHKRGR